MPSNSVPPADRLTGIDVWHYQHREKQIFIYSLGKQQQHRAEEGPLPFLFNFREEEARRRYQLKLVKYDARIPPSYIVKVDPLLPIDQQEFSLAYIKLDAEFLLPTQIYLFGPDGKKHEEIRSESNQAERPELEPRQVFPWRGHSGYKVTRRRRPAGGHRAAEGPRLRAGGRKQ